MDRPDVKRTRGLPDKGLRARIAQVLRMDPLAAQEAVEVHVERGAAVLIGEVSSWTSYHRIEDLVRGVTGLPSMVWNNLRIADQHRPRKAFWRPSRPERWTRLAGA